VGFNIITNVPGYVLIKIRRNFLHKVGFYTYYSFNIKGNGQPPVEVLLIKSEITNICIRKDDIEGRFDSDRYYQLHNTCTKISKSMHRRACAHGGA
jgi:hypothetical protein